MELPCTSPSDTPAQRAVAYLRCSTAHQIDSIPVQYTAIKRHCESEGIVLPYRGPAFRYEDADGKAHHIPVAGCFYDYGVSASKNTFLSRPSVAAMIEWMAENEVTTIIASKFTRTFRDARDCLDTVEQFTKAGVSIIVLDMPFGGAMDTRSPGSKLILQMIAAVAEYESAMIAERVSENAAYRKEKRLRVGHTPYGWMADPNDPERELPCPREYPVLHRVRHGDLSEAARVTSRDAARRLNAEGIPTKLGRKWQSATIHYLRTRSRDARPDELAAAGIPPL